MALQDLINKSVKNMGAGIHPVVKESALELVRRAYKEKIYLFITHGHRSNAEQQALYNQGRRGIKGESIVTNAKPGSSYHNYGLAVDFVLTNEAGTAAYWSVNTSWKRAAAIGKTLGFSWGGDWTGGFKDYPHLEMTGGLSISQLKAGKKPNLALKFKPSTAAAAEKEVEKVDNTPSARHKEAVEWAKAMGISDGTNPSGEPTREQVIQMLFNFYGLITPASQEPSPNFKEALEWAKAAGVSDGSKPKDYTTREQTIQMIYKAKGAK